MMGLRVCYPFLEPYERGYLDVGDGHSLYYERSGIAGGKPAVFIHGGPGAGFHDQHRCLFDPSRYDLLLFDQRGCGRSKPFLALAGNTTWDLVEDIERLRKIMEVPKWLVLGGSWGSSLALAYAQSHPNRVSELILRGIYTWSDEEARWFYQFGASEFFPEKWALFESHIPADERDDMIAAYYRRLTSTDPDVRLAAGAAWLAWETETTTLFPPTLPAKPFAFADLASPVFETHYLVHKAWLKPNQLIANAGSMRHIPGLIIHGRYDMCCRPRYAYALHQAWPGSSLQMAEGAGHLFSEPAILDRLIQATDLMVEHSPL